MIVDTVVLDKRSYSNFVCNFQIQGFLNSFKWDFYWACEGWGTMVKCLNGQVVKCDQVLSGQVVKCQMVKWSSVKCGQVKGYHANKSRSAAPTDFFVSYKST